AFPTAPSAHCAGASASERAVTPSRPGPPSGRCTVMCFGCTVMRSDRVLRFIGRTSWAGRRAGGVPGYEVAGYRAVAGIVGGGGPQRHVAAASDHCGPPLPTTTPRRSGPSATTTAATASTTTATEAIALA